MNSPHDKATNSAPDEYLEQAGEQLVTPETVDALKEYLHAYFAHVLETDPDGELNVSAEHQGLDLTLLAITHPRHELDDHAPDVLQVYCDQVVQKNGQDTHEFRSVLPHGTVEANTRFADVAHTIERNIASYPKDAIAMLQHYCGSLPEGVQVMPPEVFERPARELFPFQNDSRFDIESSNIPIRSVREMNPRDRDLPDPGAPEVDKTNMARVIDQLQSAQEKIESMATDPRYKKIYVGHSVASPMTLRIFGLRLAPQKHLKATLFPEGRKPKNVAVITESASAVESTLNENGHAHYDESLFVDPETGEFQDEDVAALRTVIESLANESENSEVHVCLINRQDKDPDDTTAMAIGPCVQVSVYVTEKNAPDRLS